MTIKRGILGTLIALLMVLQACHASVGGGVGSNTQSPMAQTQTAAEQGAQK
jgi:hypothetical protein